MSTEEPPDTASDPAAPAADAGSAGPAVEPAPTVSPEGAPAETRNMLPARESRRFGLERIAVRVIATCGIVAIGVAIAAIMVSSGSKGWLVGLVVAIVSVILSAVLWSSQSV